MIGQQKNFMLGIVAFTGSLVFAGFFGLICFSNYIKEEPDLKICALMIVGCCFFLWRAIRTLRYMIRLRAHIKTLEDEN